MRFTVLSHAGLLIEHGGKQLLCDPWLVGSAYWRSWWNYPPVDPALLEGLKPDFILLTHLHWDHFHGPSLRRFPRTTPIVIPKDHFTRMRDDLRAMRFDNIIEMPHGSSLELGPGLRVSSYHFLPTTDSALVFEAGRHVLLNANDCKLMGPPLAQLLRRHPRVDFLLRSHSSANDRLCYEFTDAANVSADDLSRYGELFCAFVAAVRPRYAIPFASNHCHLHPDTSPFNLHIQTPAAVEQEFLAYQARHPDLPTELKTMVSGDGWDEQAGFRLQRHDFFADRFRHLARYRAQVQDKLAETAAREARVEVRLEQVQAYFAKFTRAVPWPLRRAFRGTPLLFALKSGDDTRYFRYDLPAGKVAAVPDYPAQERVLGFCTSAALFQHAMRSRMFAHLGISKRVVYRVQKRDLKRMQLFNLLLKLYEYELIPLHRLWRWRLLEAYARRWREALLYLAIGIDVLLRGVDPMEIEQRYLQQDPSGRRTRKALPPPVTEVPGLR